jgi:hypothetical protein
MWPCPHFKTMYREGVIEGKGQYRGGGHSIGNNREMVNMNSCLFVNSCWEGDVWVYRYKITLNYFVNTNLTFKLQILYPSQLASENPTAELSALCISCVTIACCLAELICFCAMAAPSEIRASERFVS